MIKKQNNKKISNKNFQILQIKILKLKNIDNVMMKLKNC